MDLTAASAYIAEKYGEFQALFTRLLDLQHEAAVEVQRAAAEGRPEAERLARESVQRLARLIRLHATTEEKLDGFRSYVPGLGVVPVAYAVAAVAVAAAIAYIFSRAHAEERIVRELQRGTLTAAEATALLAATEGGGGAFQGLGSTVKWVVLGAALWFGMNLLREGRQTEV